jgi:hypothetical protein
MILLTPAPATANFRKQKVGTPNPRLTRVNSSHGKII